MKKVILVLVVVGLGLVLMVGGAFAASDGKNLTINAAVTATAKLSLGEVAIAFPDADPDAGPISATQNPVSVTAKAKTSTSGSVTLTVVTTDDLKSGSTDTIPIGNVTWTAGGAGFVGGTMNKTTGQSAGSWSGSGNRPGTFSFALANSWGYATGNYSATATYTLTAP